MIESLLNPEVLPDRPKSIQLIQTHISWVIVTDNFAYKIKKPVDFGFLNFTTPHLRKLYCEKELELNKRLCENIYLKVLNIVKKSNQIFITEGDDGEIIDYCLLMKRLPTHNMMDKLIEKEDFKLTQLNSIIKKLIPFYKNQTNSNIKDFGKKEIIAFNINENFTQTEKYINLLIDKEKYEYLREYNNKFLSENDKLFEKRMNSSIVDGHGDLYSKNICFDDNLVDVYIFDCIEFNERFRYQDVACDVGFLSMDLDYHGLYEFSKILNESIQKELNDETFNEIIDFYKCYRAYVRGKIACFTYDDPGIDNDQKELIKNEAKTYFNLALRYANYKPKDKPTLYVFYGLPGTGKTRHAKRFAEYLKIPHFNSDVIRKKIACIRETEHVYQSFEKGIYSKEMSEKTYSSLLRHAAKNLITFNSVILDATFVNPTYRILAKKVADDLDCKIKFVLFEAFEDDIRKRLEKRMNDQSNPSDAYFEIYLRQKEIFKPFDGIDDCQVYKINTSLDNNFDEIYREIATT